MDCSTSILPIIEARCDWITATGRKDSKAGDLADIAMGNINGELSAGFEQQSWRFQGYYGFKAGEWAWGYGEHGTVVCVSGANAEMAARTLAEHSDHFSRVDYCVTAVDDTETIRPDVEYWVALRKRQLHELPTTAFTRIQNSDSGATFTIGSRSAAVYARTYQKAIESEGAYAKGSWRWEIELKRHRSDSEQRRQCMGERTPADVLALVASEYAQRHLPVPWRTNTAVERDRCPTREQSIAKTLKWFELIVAPAIERSVAVVGARRVRELLKL